MYRGSRVQLSWVKKGLGKAECGVVLLSKCAVLLCKVWERRCSVPLSLVLVDCSYVV